MILKVKKISPEAKIPTYQTKEASGLDLYADKNISIESKSYCAVGTGICIEIPSGYEGQVRPRSGLALKYGLGLLNAPGTIDADYRGEIRVVLFNFGENKVEIKKGSRIAQLVIAPVCKVELQESELSESERGEKGFGSTGLLCP